MRKVNISRQNMRIKSQSQHPSLKPLAPHHELYGETPERNIQAEIDGSNPRTCYRPLTSRLYSSFFWRSSKPVSSALIRANWLPAMENARLLSSPTSTVAVRSSPVSAKYSIPRVWWSRPRAQRVLRPMAISPMDP